MTPAPRPRSLTTARPGGVAPIEVHTEVGVVGVNGDYTRITARPDHDVIRQARKATP